MPGLAVYFCISADFDAKQQLLGMGELPLPHLC